MLKRAVHPGLVLKEELAEISITPTEFARQIDVPPNRVSQIINGRRAITGDTALRFGHWFGVEPEFWLNLQTHFDLVRADQQSGKAIGGLPTGASLPPVHVVHEDAHNAESRNGGEPVAETETKPETLAVYRFRSTEKLLQYEELEKQTIYFADAEELNDPMEGIRDIFWQGDRIVWTNLFRHYLYCLNVTYIYFRVLCESAKLGSEYIPVMRSVGRSVSDEGINLFEDVCDRVFGKAEINDFITEIVNANRISRRAEVLLYLKILHHTALREVQNAHIDRGLQSDRKAKIDIPSPFRGMKGQFAFMTKSENDRINDDMFEVSSQLFEGMFLRHKYNFRTSPETMSETQRHNRDFIVFDFPDLYLQQIETLLYPQWYVAAFTKEHQNSSMWGHYGNNHKGICLIFESKMADGVSNITLNSPESASSSGEIWRPSRMEFYDVSYGDRITEIDFFRSLGKVPRPELEEVWYRDKDGNLSECGVHLKAGTQAWRDSYWERFYPPLSVKSLNWEHERETRLVLYSLLGDLDNRSRALTYDFDTLKGIIFGIRTSNYDKQKIIEIIHKKCQENNRTDFKFFQAYYSPESGSIQKYELSLKLSEV